MCAVLLPSCSKLTRQLFLASADLFTLEKASEHTTEVDDPLFPYLEYLLLKRSRKCQNHIIIHLIAVMCPEANSTPVKVYSYFGSRLKFPLLCIKQVSDNYPFVLITDTNFPKLLHILLTFLTLMGTALRALPS